MCVSLVSMDLETDSSRRAPRSTRIICKRDVSCEHDDGHQTQATTEGNTIRSNRIVFGLNGFHYVSSPSRFGQLPNNNNNK